jgi:hypothetical protein
MTFRGKIKRMEITLYPCIFDQDNQVITFKLSSVLAIFTKFSIVCISKTEKLL